MNNSTHGLTIPHSVAVVSVVLGILSGIVLATGPRTFPNLHTALDTTVFLLSVVLALLFWDMGARMNRPFVKRVALSFAVTAALGLVHVLVTIEWFGIFSSITQSANTLRPTTWPPAIHVLPIGILFSLWSRERDKQSVLGFGISLVLLGFVLSCVFFEIPRYTAPTFLGVTRPSLITVPILWAIITFICWRCRNDHRIYLALLPTSAVLFAGGAIQLYSRAPHDSVAMAAHILIGGGYLVLLLTLMRIASLDMVERFRAEERLALLNDELERRVLDRTLELMGVNKSLKAEVNAHQRTEAKLRVQLGQLDLLNHVTRAIGERQDLQSIFHVVISTLEADVPIDFGCICLCDEHRNTLNVASSGNNSHALAQELGLMPGTLIPVKANELMPCMQGELVYNAELGATSLPFAQMLAQGGLRSMVVTPLVLQDDVFGAIIAAKRSANSFGNDERELLRQLGEHVALAARQAQLHVALQRAYDDLRLTREVAMQQERLRAFGEMASGVAHDINNAISPVTMYAEMLLDGEPNLSERALKALRVIQRAAGDVANTIARLREFYRQRELPTELEPVSINNMVRQVIDLTRSRWNDMPQQSGIMIEVLAELTPDAPSVLGIESELRDALINLIFNAVDAMPNGGKLTLRTTVTERATSSGVGAKSLHLEVIDTGVGMDDIAKKRCTEPFFTTKGERGTGLGLAMVLGSMSRHSAEVEIDSAKGKGTTVRINFPVPMAIVARPERISEIRTVTTRLRILLVDDDSLILKGLQESLAIDGHDIVPAVGGQAGIDAFKIALDQNRPFAVVFTDLGMPYVDGHKVAYAVKTRAPGTTVILLTGWGQQLNAEGTPPPYVDRVLSKPPKLRELRDALTLAFENTFK